MAYRCTTCNQTVTGVCTNCHGGNVRRRSVAAAGGSSRTQRQQKQTGRVRRSTGQTRRGFWRWFAG